MTAASHELGVARVFAGEGAVAVQARALDWSRTPFGPVAAWPDRLKHHVELMLAAAQPMFIAWGPSRSLLYNDAYSALIGGKAPAALGRPFAEVWAEAMGDLQPLLDDISLGQPVQSDDLRLMIDRRGALEPAHFAFSYTPLHDDDGAVAGLFCACVETTSAVAARQALAISESRLQAVLDTVSDGFYAVDSDWRFTVFNAAAEAFFGRSREAVIGRLLWDVFPEARDSDLEHACRAVMAGGPPVVFETQSMTRPDRFVEMRAARKRQGGLAVAFSDITERRAADLRRQESEAVLRAFFDNDGLYTSILELVEEQPVYVAGNRSFNRLLGVDSVEGMTTAEVLGRRAVKGTVDVMRHVESTGRAYGFEHAANGRWFSATVAPIQGAGGRVLFAATSIDITERREAELALRDSEARFRAITETLPQIVWSARPDGFHDYFNPRWYEFTGLPEGASDGGAWNDVLHPEDQSGAMALWTECLATGADYSIEHRLRHHDGRYRWILSRARAVRDAASGEIVRWMGTCTDIQEIVTAREVLTRSHDELEAAVVARTAELVQTQEQLRQSQKMEAVGQLTGGIAHDFNNLLQGITGSLDLMGARVAQGRTAELARYLDGAIASANRAAALTHRLLAFSRRQPLDPKPVAVDALIAGIEDLLRRTLGENVELELVSPPDPWTTRCDANQLESAILNLAINARDAMPDGGKLTIETGNAHVAGAEPEAGPGDYVCIRVTDTGAGMASEVAERAFEPFFTTKPMGQGTGLGLSMIYGFARQSQGFCRLESALGQGTTVSLHLPRYEGPAEDAAARESPAPPPGRSGTVLVVEDEPVVRAIVVEALQEQGYRTREAADAPAALEQLSHAGRVDLLLTDIGLPGLSGRRLAETVRAEHPAQKVLFMTGYAEDAAGAEGFLEPGMALITKPFTIAALTERVRALLEP